jgi:hypothetical protein
MKDGKWKKAILSLKKSETWPENLFSGEPYFPDNRLTQFMAAFCFEKLRIKVRSDQIFDYLKTYKNPDGWTSQLGNSLTEQAVSGNRNYKSITDKLLSEKANSGDMEILRLFLSIL